MTEKRCETCIYWDNDTGFCSVETIPKIKSEICEFWDGGVEFDQTYEYIIYRYWEKTYKRRNT